MRKFSSYIDVIDMWPSLSDFAKDLGIDRKHVNVMRCRASLPPAYWNKVVAAARERRYGDITLSLLARIATKEHIAKGKPWPGRKGKQKP